MPAKTYAPVAPAAAPPAAAPRNAPAWKHALSPHGKLRWTMAVLAGYVAPLVALAPSAALLFAALAVGGFAYVGGVTEERANPLGSRRPAHGLREFTKTLMALPLLYFASGRFAVPDGARAEQILEPLSDWRASTDRQLVALLQALYAGAFVAGIGFTYLDKVPALQRIELSAKGLRTSGVLQAAVIAVIVVLLVGLLGYAGAVHFQQGTLPWVCLGVGIALVAISVETWRLRQSHHIHVHHYLVGGAVVLMTGFPGLVGVVAHGYGLGLFVEGIARWSMAPLLERNR